MLRFPAPTPLVGSSLEAEIVAAGFRNIVVLLDGDTVRVDGRTQGGRRIDDRDAPQIAAVVAAHTAAPSPEQVRREQRRARRARLVELFGRGYRSLSASEQDEASALLAQVLDQPE